HVVIHSTFMSAGAIGRFLAMIQEKASSGRVEFDILWGDTGGAQTETWRQAKIIEEHFRNKGIKTVRVAAEPTGSHCKLLLADSGRDGSYEAVLGSCNWLSSPYTAADVSVRLRDLRLVRDVANVLAGLQMPPSGRWDQSVMRLVRIAEACRKNAR